VEVVEKPWGFYEVLVDEPIYKVKRITIKPNELISLQYHGYRNEFWVVVDGELNVYVDGITKTLKYGDGVIINKSEKHRAVNYCNRNCVFIEIQTGDKLLEEDIIRLQDKYGRV